MIYKNKIFMFSEHFLSNVLKISGKSIKKDYKIFNYIK